MTRGAARTPSASNTGLPVLAPFGYWGWRMGRRAFCVAIAALCAVAPAARAQTTRPPVPRDTVAAPAPPLRADTLAADSLRRLARLAERRDALARQAPDPLAPADTPARLPASDLAAAALLARPGADGASLPDARGTFALRSDGIGFPLALVRWGLAPVATVVTSGEAVPLHGAQSLATGAARPDVVPLSAVASLAWRGAALVAPRRRFDAPRPLTELRYDAGAGQRVEVTHAQARRRRLARADGIARLALTYAGRGGDGPADNQRLTRGRTLDARLAFDADPPVPEPPVPETPEAASEGAAPRPATRAEIGVTHHRATFGASGGLVPPDAADPYSIFDGLRARARDATSSRRTLGTSATLDVARGRAALAVGADTETLRFHAAATSGATGDTTEARVRRVRAALRLPLGIATLAAGAALDAASGAATATVLTATARLGTATTAGPVRLRLDAGADIEGSALVPAGRLDAAISAGRIALTAEASQALAPVSAVRRGGFGRFLPAAADEDRGAVRVRLARIGASVGRGDGLRVGVDAFASETRGWTWRAAPGALVAASGGSETVRATGAVASVGLRETAGRGLYAAAWAQARIGAATPGVPPVFGDARAGARAVLFRGDLDADAFVRLRAWDGVVSRVLHEPTGLLLLPSDALAATVRAGTQLDLVATARVRTATLTLALDDALAGTALTRGSLTVPGYPFAGRRLRVSVFWPIFD